MHPFRYISFVLFMMLLFAITTGGNLKAQINYDSIVKTHTNINTDSRLKAFVTYIENTDNVIGAATEMSIERYSDIVETAIQYCTKTNNNPLKRRCILYRHLVPNKYSKIYQLRELKKISLNKDVQKSKHYLKLLLNLRSIYKDLELFDQFLAMVDEIKKHNNGNYSDDDIEYMRLTDRSSMFYRTKNYKKALSTFIELGEFTKKERWLEESSRLNNMGLCYQAMGKGDSAIVNFKKAIKAHEKYLLFLQSATQSDSFFYKVIKSNIEDIQVQKGIFKDAETTFLRQLEYSDNYGPPQLVLSSYLSLAKLEYQRNNFTKSLAYIDSIKQQYAKSGFVSYFIDALKLKSKIHLEQNDRALAREAEVRFNYLQDSIRSAKAERNYQAAAIQLEMNEALVKVNEVNTRLNEQKNKSKRLIYGLLLAFLFIGASILGLYLFRKKNKLLSQQTHNLDNAIKEREILLREIHHRVKNNLNVVSSLVQLQSRRIEDAEIKKIFKESQNYILSMSKVHQFLYEQESMTHIGMEAYFKSLLNELLGGYPNFELEQNVLVKSINLTLDQALVLGILTSELVTNSIKYAFPDKKGKITLTMSLKDSLCTFSYADSGPGFNLGQKTSNNSFGLKLVRMSAEQLRGSLDIKTDDLFFVSIRFNIK